MKQLFSVLFFLALLFIIFFGKQTLTAMFTPAAQPLPTTRGVVWPPTTKPVPTTKGVAWPLNKPVIAIPKATTKTSD